ncbi:hypothetical protein EV138_0945 [Kribbella voronezhensis]|uniref:HEAT repeat protein n=1 Tax=Kribbella voronezhensis TaxID=2512212 RepID=A0A4R7T6B8_9ACTN|nr:hypothetical protein [Kribbella voronezhensis]TDU87422.1 hypothetical protein EV138_0945 [Kribbella voronezhensis]
MQATELLRSLDSLPYGERSRLIAQEAQRLRGTQELVGLLEQLSRGAAFERVLGLQLAQIAGQADYVAHLLADPDPTVQARALVAVSRGVAVSDQTLHTLYDDAPAALRGKLLRVIRRTGRHELATRLIEEHRDRWGDRSAAAILSSTDSATVGRLLPELAYWLSAGEWQRLAVKHPAAVLACAEQTLPTGADWQEWWQGIAYGVVALLDRDDVQPHLILALLDRALPANQLPRAITQVLGRLIDLDRELVLRILLTPDRAALLGNALTPAVCRRLHRFSDDELGALGRLLWPNAADLLADLPPSRRTAVFAAITGSLDLSRTDLPTALLDVLPQNLRHEQARRMLELPIVAENTRRRWEVTAYLPYDEAFALLEPEIRRPEADDRVTVYRAVISSAGHSRQPAAVQAALSWATRVRNDREPVRQAVLAAAAALPPSVLADEHVTPLQTLLTDALEARDTSWLVRSALNQLAEYAVREGALRNQSALLDWGLESHARLTENRGTVNLYGLIDGLPRGRELAVYEALRPYVEAAAARREFDLAFAIAAAFGRRGWTNEHLHRVLEQAVWSNKEYVVGRAAELWLQPTSTRAERVGRIIKRDVGMARWDAVWRAVTEVRTDLLDPVLAKPERSHRFDRNQPSWQVPDSALRRWLPRQHVRYADLLTTAARDKRMSDWSRAAAVSALGHLPDIGRAAVDPFLTSDQVLLQEAALGALAWTSQPELALPALLVHAGDDRARVAVYAATRAARFVRPSRLAAAFQPLLVGDGVKVTSRKEAARLLGELRAPGASEVLTDAWGGAHRDVRAAITSTASQYLLHEPGSWALLQQAVHDSDATALALTARQPLDIAEKYRARYGDLLIAVTARSEPEVVAAALAALARWGRWIPAAAEVCGEFVTDLSSRSPNWRTAVDALAAMAGRRHIGELDDLLEVVRLLLRHDDDPGAPDGEADRDRPAWRRLTVLVDSVEAAVRQQPLERRAGLRILADELSGVPSFLPHRLHLLVTATSWASPADDLRQQVSLVADRPVAANFLSELVRNALVNSTWRPADLSGPADELTRTGNLASGLLACTLVSAAGTYAGWPAEWRTRLLALRRHPDADVQQLAIRQATAEE